MRTAIGLPPHWPPWHHPNVHLWQSHGVYGYEIMYKPKQKVGARAATGGLHWQPRGATGPGLVRKKHGTGCHRKEDSTAALGFCRTEVRAPLKFLQPCFGPSETRPKTKGMSIGRARPSPRNPKRPTPAASLASLWVGGHVESLGIE